MDYQEKVKNFLDQYLIMLRTAILDAWETYHKDFGENSFKLFPLGHSVIMNNLVIRNVMKIFSGYNNIEIKRNGHGAILTIRSSREDFKVDLRFKKLNKYYKTQNARSARNSRFLNQEPYLGEVFLPKPILFVNLNAGYKIDEAWSLIDIWITCPNGATTIAWKFQITDEGIAPTKEIPIVPITTPPTQTTKRTEKIPSKIPDQQKAIEGHQ